MKRNMVANIKLFEKITTAEIRSPDAPGVSSLKISWGFMSTDVWIVS